MQPTVAILGMGRLGTALARALSSGGLSPEKLLAGARRNKAAQSPGVSSDHITEAGSNLAAAGRSDMILICVKPNDVAAVLDEISPAVTGQLVVSAAAGITTAFIEKRLPDSTPVIRSMPNAPAAVGAGITALSPGRFATPEHVEQTRRLFAAAGEVIVVREDLMDAVTAVSGSGPAYFALFIKALADAAQTLGLDSQQSLILAAGAAAGTTGMLAGGRTTPEQLIETVASPGGTTQAALDVLASKGVPGAINAAVKAAMHRSAEISKQAEQTELGK